MKTIPAWALLIVGVLAGGLAGVFIGQILIWSDATNSTIGTTATAVGGLGSMVGGIAAAIAASQSGRSASESKDAAAQLSKIGSESRLALGRAMKPQIDPQLLLGAGKSSLVLRNTGQWPARDLAVTVDIPGREQYCADQIGGVEPGGDSAAKRFDDLPRPPEPLDDWLKEHEISDRGTLEVRAMLSYSDRDRILHHTDELRYEVTFAYGPNWSMEDAPYSIVRSSEVSL